MSYAGICDRKQLLPSLPDFWCVLATTLSWTLKTRACPNIVLVRLSIGRIHPPTGSGQAPVVDSIGGTRFTLLDKAINRYRTMLSGSG